MRFLIEKIQRLFENISEEEKFFIDRTKNHIRLVSETIDKLVAYGNWQEFSNAELIRRKEKHDLSKFEEPERTPYIELTWCKKQGIRSNNPEIHKATMHHVLNNSHHPEYWNPKEANIDLANRDKANKPIDVSKMPNIDIAEMCCDWVAMGIEMGNTAKDWYKKVKDIRWIFQKNKMN